MPWRGVSHCGGHGTRMGEKCSGFKSLIQCQVEDRLLGISSCKQTNEQNKTKTNEQKPSREFH